MMGSVDRAHNRPVECQPRILRWLSTVMSKYRPNRALLPSAPITLDRSPRRQNTGFHEGRGPDRPCWQPDIRLFMPLKPSLSGRYRVRSRVVHLMFALSLGRRQSDARQTPAGRLSRAPNLAPRRVQARAASTALRLPSLVDRGWDYFPRPADDRYRGPSVGPSAHSDPDAPKGAFTEAVPGPRCYPAPIIRRDASEPSDGRTVGDRAVAVDS